MFNRALWRKTTAESLILLLPVAFVLAGFCWLFVYLTNNMAIAKLPTLLKYILPTHLLQLNSMKLDDWGTRNGVLSAIYIHPIVEFTCIVWALVRGSAAVSGEISRGTMEMLLAQPISRWAILTSNAVTAVIGSAVLAAATLVGLWAGAAMFPIRMDEPSEPQSTLVQQATESKDGLVNFATKVIGAAMTGRPAPKAEPQKPEEIRFQFFIPAALLLGCYTACIAGVCTLVSSWDHYRFRTIGTIGIWGVTQIVFDVVVRWVRDDNPLKYLKYFTIKTCFEPQRLLFCEPGEQIGLMWQYCSVFLGVGLLCYLAAGVVFSRRDLPTPL